MQWIWTRGQETECYRNGGNSECDAIWTYLAVFGIACSIPATLCSVAGLLYTGSKLAEKCGYDNAKTKLENAAIFCVIPAGVCCALICKS